MTADLRVTSFINWLENKLFLHILKHEPASSDASFRRYFRVTSPKGQFIVMDAPPAKENIQAFIHVAALMQRSGLHVPEIYGQNSREGFLLLEDFGTQSFLEALNSGNPADLYQAAMDNLFLLQTRAPLQDGDLPVYDEALLQRELEIFDEWFLNKLHGIQLPVKLWDTVRSLLIASALEQPVCCVHRDYHSRNLMVLADNTLGILDFQDAVIGPVSYDLVSLLKDCYVTLPGPLFAGCLSQYHGRLLQAGLICCDFTQFKRWFDLMGMQRHLKAIGIFSRLHLRDGKSAYLDDIPRTLAYVMAVCAGYPELRDFYQFLSDYVLPVHKVKA